MYLKGTGIIDSAGRKVRSKREQDLIMARIYGQKDEVAQFTRLQIESRVARPLLLEAYQLGAHAAANPQQS